MTRKTTTRPPVEVAAAAWDSLGAPKRVNTLYSWVDANLTAAEVRECAVAFLWRELEATERRRTLAAERAATRPAREASTDDDTEADDTEADRRAAAAREEADQQAARRIATLATLATLVEDAVAAHEAALSIEWTPELREQPIRMPDGSRTSWGEATIAQHRQREAMFTDFAVANVEGAARHRRAIDDLTAAGVATLNDLVAAEPGAA